MMRLAVSAECCIRGHNCRVCTNARFNNFILTVYQIQIIGGIATSIKMSLRNGTEILGRNTGSNVHVFAARRL